MGGGGGGGGGGVVGLDIDRCIMLVFYRPLNIRLRTEIDSKWCPALERFHCYDKSTKIYVGSIPRSIAGGFLFLGNLVDGVEESELSWPKLSHPGFTHGIARDSPSGISFPVKQ